MNKVLGRLMVGLSLLIVFVVSFSYGAAKGDWFDSDKWSNGSMLNSITFGYVYFHRRPQLWLGLSTLAEVSSPGLCLPYCSIYL